MSFIEKLNKASFRGFEFSTSSETKGFGNDVRKKKAINGKVLTYEDVGVKETSFNIEATIGGRANFQEMFEEFERLLNVKGEGRLILPHEGEMLAVVTEARRMTTDKKVGTAVYSITFERVDEHTYEGGSSTSYEVQLQASNVNAAAMNEFQSSFIPQVPDFALNAAALEISGFLNNIQSGISSLRNISTPELPMNSAYELTKTIGDFFENITSFEDKVSYTVASPAAATIDNTGALEIAHALSAAAAPNNTSLLNISDASSDSLRAKNTQSSALLMRSLSASAAAIATSFAEFESKQEALGVRDDVLAVLSDVRREAGEMGWSDTYLQIGTLMADVNADINTGIGRLPETININNKTNRSALALAHRLYGDSAANVFAKADDITKRNGVEHPGFLPATELEVLIDV
ncbi:MAG: hypothetical protein CBB87_08015 [Micavibrio sp. TMED27]|nr:hypothetical protein [Micavibrio sp.]OUT90616.1 MAG: hypothetical protein CBB87_08015 [Micavibrio sp. TMED27]|tara:strand:- start:10981 stop:12201 length:1221 start_codon:yes stop_codon:yes gene_type:complete